jgi:3-hydroxy-9,10-secoandrosta-1,3,5(10)-triene-9,17-dione monooxygenase
MQTSQNTATALGAMPAPPDEKELLRRAYDYAKTLRARSLEIAHARQVPEDVMADIGRLGLLQLARPARYGGRDLGMDSIFRIGRAIASGDGSVAWVYCVSSSHDHLVGMYPKHIQDDYWASEQPLCASSYMPTGRAEPVQNGWLVSGKWSFCSGIDFCGWIVVGAITVDPAQAPQPELRFFLIKKSELTLVDDWHVMGLSGTGSKSVMIDSVVIPNDRVLRNVDVMAGKTPGGVIHTNPMYRTSVWPLFGFSILAPATGIARGALDFMVSQLRPKSGGAPAAAFDAKLHGAQQHLAEAGVLVDAAELLYERGLQETTALIQGSKELPIELRVRNRRDQAYLAGMCRKSVDILMGMSGGRGIREEGVIQRAFRDLYAISAHPGGNWDVASASYGSVLLGGPPTEMFQ